MCSLQAAMCGVRAVIPRHRCVLKNVRSLASAASLSSTDFPLCGNTNSATRLHSANCRHSQRLNRLRFTFSLQCRQCFSLARVPQLDLGQDRSEMAKTKAEEEEEATETLKNLGPEDQQKLKIIQLEFEVMEHMAMGEEVVPEVMTNVHWLHALGLNSRMKRAKYYLYLRKLEFTKENQERKKKEKQQQREEEEKQRLRDEETAAEASSSDPDDRRWKNTIFLRLYDSTIAKAGDNRLANAMQFGQPLIFDMDYERFMRNQDIRNLVFQLSQGHVYNRSSIDPFHFMFTNVDPNGEVLPLLWKNFLAGQQFMGTVTQSSYLDLFPRSQLVYLSPDATEMLDTVDPGAVYIIGGVNDKAGQQKESFARAKEQRIRSACLPLDRYLLWGHGSKSLTLNQVIPILLEQKRTGDWNEAFKVVPKRKLYNPELLDKRQSRNKKKSMAWLKELGEL